MDNEFKEIDSKGGTFTFNSDGTAAYSFSKPEPLELTHTLIVSYNGYLLDVGNFSNNNVPYPSVEIIMIPDKENLYGRKCPNCSKYFRNKCCGKYTYCPYCVYRGNSIEFVTEAQMNFIRLYFDKFSEVLGKQDGTSCSVSLDNILNKMENNKSQFKLLDESQQLKITCSKDGCRNIFDILGHYGFCPACRTSNINGAVEIELQNKDISFGESVSCFEAFANHIRDNILAFLPNTKARGKEISTINFQNINCFPESLKTNCGINVMDKINREKQELIQTMYEVRHLLTHKKCAVDQRFIDRAQEFFVKNGYDKLRMGQEFKFKDQDRLKYNRQFADLVKIMSFNLLRGVEEILDARDQIPILSKIVKTK